MIKPNCPPKVVLVEDDPEQLNELTGYFQHFGWAVRPALDAFVGLDAICEVRPTLAVVQAALPGISGARLAEIATMLDPKVQIILISDDEPDGQDCASASLYPLAVLKRPIDLDELGAIAQTVATPQRFALSA